ncbi:MAG: hypothetical protein ACREM3_28550 [Candidatus Rokuibacteriota bacterium]
MSAPAPFIVVHLGPRRYYVARLVESQDDVPCYETTGYMSTLAVNAIEDAQRLARGERPR